MARKNNDDQIEILNELLELSIKSGRRMMHDFDHMLNEIPQSNPMLKEFQIRAEIWRSIFYPDDGMKNYRTEMHKEIDSLEWEIKQLKKQIQELGEKPDDGLPF